jgi:hypothetical protein
MNKNTKIAIQSAAIMFIIFISSFITMKAREWFPPATEIRVVFEDCVFSEMPALRPIKDNTNYYFKGCRLNGQDFGETISPSEVDEAIAKLDEKEKP